MTYIDETETSEQKSATQSIADDVRSTAKEASSAAKQQANKKLDENRQKVADEIGSLAHAARVAAADLRANDHEGLSHYVTDLADHVTSLASGLRKKNIDELIDEAHNIARKNPALFIGGSIAIGLGVARFAKASGQRARQHANNRDADTSDSESPMKNDTLATQFTGDYTAASSKQNESSSQGLGRSSQAGKTGSMGAGMSKQNSNETSTIGANRYE